MKKYILILIGIIITGVVSMIIFVNYNINVEQIPVLAYHNIVPDNISVSDDYSINVFNFEKQMKYLKDNGYTTLTMDQFYCWKKKTCHVSKKSVLLTFDDGYYSIYYLVRPILEKYGYHGISFIVGKWTPLITNNYNPNEYGVVGFDIINTPDKTIEYQSHSYNMHQVINNKHFVLIATKKELDDDVTNMAKIIDSKYLAYPYYCENKKIREVLKKHNYKLAFRRESEKAARSANDYQIPRIQIDSDFNAFKDVFETKKYNNRYGNGIIRKIFINIERRITKTRIF